MEWQEANQYYKWIKIEEYGRGMKVVKSFFPPNEIVYVGRIRKKRYHVAIGISEDGRHKLEAEIDGSGGPPIANKRRIDDADRVEILIVNAGYEPMWNSFFKIVGYSKSDNCLLLKPFSDHTDPYHGHFVNVSGNRRDFVVKVDSTFLTARKIQVHEQPSSYSRACEVLSIRSYT